MNMLNPKQLLETFEVMFSDHPQLYFAPGRINLIGEHTDYNNGFVLPAPIQYGVTFAIAPNYARDVYHFFSHNFNDFIEVDASNLRPGKKLWGNYLIGVVAQFKKRGFKLGGFDCVFGGDVPSGAGLSSSAAITCGLAFALNDIFGCGLPLTELVEIARSTEHEYAGVLCGIMDQTASLYGKEGHLLQLDCQSKEIKFIPFDNKNYSLVVFDTTVKHQLSDSEYNVRRAECEKGVAHLMKIYPKVASLRDVTIDMLAKAKPQMDPIIWNRCQYVVEENLRVMEMSKALLQNDYKNAGKLMYASHEGLSRLYEVSCLELDYLVDYSRNMEGVLGARLMGAGFGGSALYLVQKAFVEKISKEVSVSYNKKFGQGPNAYPVQIGVGACKMPTKIS